MDFRIENAECSSNGYKSVRGTTAGSLDILLTEACIHSSQPHRMHQISDEIKRITYYFREKQIPIYEFLQSKLLDFCYTHFNYSLEVVTFACIDAFSNLLYLHAQSCDSCRRDSCIFMQKIGQNLINVHSSNKARIKSLLIWLKFNRRSLPSMYTIDYLYRLLTNTSFIIPISDLIIYDISVSAEHLEFHLECLCRVLNDTQADIIVRHRLLPLLFKDSTVRKFIIANRDRLINPTNCRNTLELELILANLCISYSDTNRAQWKDFISEDHLLKALMHSSEELRLSAWKLLCFHPKTTWPVNIVDIRLAKSFLVSNMTEQVPSRRQDLFKGLNKMLLRIRESARLKSSISLDVTYNMDDYRSFVHFLFELAFESLVPGANFNRRLSGLLILQSLYESLRLKPDKLCEDFPMDSWLSEIKYRRLLTCLDDSFQLCQNLSFHLLDQMHCLISDKNFMEVWRKSLFQVETLKSNSHLSAGARLQFICHKRADLLQPTLDRLISICSRNVDKIHCSILSICDNAPIFPALHSIHSVLYLYRDFSQIEPGTSGSLKKFIIDEIIPLCFQASILVSPVVHSLSPEGFAPNEWLDNENDIESRTSLRRELSQKLLVGCWRAHQNISKIFLYAIECLPSKSLLESGLLRKIEDYLWIQLTECKHRGAFEIAAVAFDALCQRLWSIKSDTQQLKKLQSEQRPNYPEELLVRVMEAINGIRDIDKLCSTRRSAGLPHLVCALLRTIPKSHAIGLTSSTIASLLEFEHLPESLQVHRINILKTVFSETKLSEKVLPFAERAFMICFEGFENSSWPVRNSLCQLYAALLRRIFGSTRMTQRSLRIQDRRTKSAFDFFTRFPNLYGYIHEKLSEYVSTSSEFSIFPISVLLCHLFPSPSEPRYCLSIYVPNLICIWLRSYSERLRELSISALLSISDDEDLRRLFSWILVDKRLDTCSWNTYESILLLILITIDFGRANDFTAIFESFLSRHSIDQMPDYVLQNFLNVASLIGSPNLQKKIITDLSSSLSEDNVPKLNLTTRPFGNLLAKNTELWSNIMALTYEKTFLKPFMVEVRYEAYRAIVLESIDPTLDILNSAVEDFHCCITERHIEFIIPLLIKNFRSIGDKFEIVKVSCELLLDSRILSKISSKISLVELIQVSNGLIGPRHIDLLNEARKDDCFEVRLTCLNILNRLRNISNKTDTIVRMAALLLQDEESEIRIEAARVLSKELFGREDELNPSVLWSLALKKFPDLANEIKEEYSNITMEDDVFEACSRNPYAENFVMPYFDVIEERICNMIV